jgi:hypothetical protein
MKPPRKDGKAVEVLINRDVLFICLFPFGFHLGVIPAFA